MRYNRPVFGLILPGDQSGCSFHRCVRPLEIMSRHGICAGRIDPVFRSSDELGAILPNFVTFQRQSDESQVAEIDRYREALPKAWFNFEIDDSLSQVPEKSWHRPYMTPNIDAKLRNAAKRCNVVTVSTIDLADHMATVCEPGTKIRVVPNELGRDDLERTLQVCRGKPHAERKGKLRVGWGGGIGHIGDLEMLNPVFEELKSEIEWFFIGMNPVTPNGVVKTFLGAASTQDYLAAMAAMDIDLMIAPLEDNLFNRCKSNLRLLEGGACFFPTIASPVAPYFTDSPPLVAYANSTADWVEEIRKFAKLSEGEKKKHGERLHDWVLSKYVLDDHPDRRLLQWLPDHTRIFKPKLKQKGSGLSIVSTSDDLYAQFNTSNDILYMRPGSFLPPDALERLKSSTDDIVLPLSNDGGPWGFPAVQQFTPVDPNAVAQINTAAAKCDHAPIPLVAASGPAVLMRRSALDAVGMPDVDTLSVEIAILEWSVCAKSRGMSLSLLPTVYVGAQAPYQPNPGETELAAQRIQLRWPQNKFDDAPLVAFRQTLELEFHRANYTTLPPANRSDYSYWASSCDEPGPKVVTASREWTKSLPQSPGIAHHGYPCTVPKGDEYTPEWAFFTPKDATFPATWHAHLADAIRANPDAKIIYADHDYVTPHALRVGPDFKPNFDIHMLLSRDYVTQAMCVNVELLEGLVGEEWPKGGITESSLYDLVLDTVTELGASAIAHCPRVLAHLPVPTSQEPPPYLADHLRLARDFAERHNFPGTVDSHPHLLGLREISYTSPTTHPRAHIIVPTRDRLDLVAPCVATVFKMTTYDNFDVTIIDNGSTKEDILAWFKEITDPFTADPRVKILRHDEPFNFSRLNNFAVEEINPAPDDILIFLNDDTRVVGGDWLSELVGATLLPTIGAVGAKLVYPHGMLQHMGLFCHHDLIGNIHKGLALNNPGVGAYAVTSHEATAVTAACMAVKASNFTLAGGFDESLANNFNDVALCLNLRKHGLINLVACKAELQHMEGATRSNKMDQRVFSQLMQDLQTFREKFGTKLENGQWQLPPDPYWNPNLQLFHSGNYVYVGGADMNVYTYPPPAPPWEFPKREKILLIGPEGPIAENVRDGAIIYRLEVSGNHCRINLPPMNNCGPWDIRDPIKAEWAINKLELDRIVLTNLGEAPLQLLDFITRVGVPVHYKPFNVESLCPRGGMQVQDKFCARGFATGECRTCLRDNGSPHGVPRTDGWILTWMDFLDRCASVDLDMLTNVPEFVEAMNFIFGGGGEQGNGAATRPESDLIVESRPEHFRTVAHSHRGTFV